MGFLRYVTHPNVEIDPAVPVPEWSLSDVGRRRARALLSQPWIGSVGAIVSSGETKARETAAVLAAFRRIEIEERPDTGEIDRSSTGFVPPERHDALAVRLFAEPERSADGWETAVAAQHRIVAATADLVADAGEVSEPSPGAGADVVIVGHGGVGTLLWCHLAGEVIDGRYDQPGQGHYWSFDRSTGRVVHGWWPVDDLDDPNGAGL
ncbi:MAG: histidine phosphatase family protein [Actinomycetota bacterium]